MWRSAAAPLVSSGRQRASHCHDAAGALRQLRGQLPVAAGPDALDEGLSRSAKVVEEHVYYLETTSI